MIKVDLLEGCQLDQMEEFTQSMAEMLAHYALPQRTQIFRIYHVPTQRTLMISLTSSGTWWSRSQEASCTHAISRELKRSLPGILHSIQSTSDWQSMIFTHT